jgi:hypothetical protein
VHLGDAMETRPAATSLGRISMDEQRMRKSAGSNARMEIFLLQVVSMISLQVRCGVIFFYIVEHLFVISVDIL